MAQNYIQPGDVLPYVVPEATTINSGALVQVGRAVGVALGSGTAGQTIQVSFCGVYRVPKSTSVIVQGDPLYFDVENERLSTLPENKAFAGFAAADAGSSDPEVDVKLSEGASAFGVLNNIAEVTTADGSDPATTQTLVNVLKVRFNALLLELKNAGLMPPDA